MPAEQMAGPALRWGRAAGLAAVLLGFSSVAHALAGGVLPGPVGMSALATLTVVASAALLGPPATTTRVVSLVALGQAALHTVFTATGGHGGTGSGHGSTQGPLRLPDGRLADLLGAEALGVTATHPGRLETSVHHLAADVASSDSWLMAGAHLAAAAVVGWWLARGERLAWRLVALLSGHVDAALRSVRALACTAGPVAVPLPARRPAAPDGHLVAPRLIVLAPAVSRRGPPATS